MIMIQHINDTIYAHMNTQVVQMHVSDKCIIELSDKCILLSDKCILELSDKCM